MASTEALAQHPPAMKVGGRRLSLNSRPRPPTTTLDAPKTSPPQPADNTPPDYPRPSAPASAGEQQVHQQHQQQQQEEEVPKRKQQQGPGGDEHERRIQESLHRKAEQNRPKKELGTGPKVASRIGQPAGKALGL